MLEELQRRNYSSEMIRSYIFAVREFTLGKSPECLGAEELRHYQVHLLQERKLAPNTVEGRPKKMPLVLSHEEVTQLIEAAVNLLYRTMLALRSGLRRAEVVRPKVDDIDKQGMVIRVRLGKGARHRDGRAHGVWRCFRTRLGGIPGWAA